MNLKSTGITALILTALLSWYYFYEVKGKEGREKAKNDAKLVFQAADTGDIASISEGTVLLKKANGIWQLTQPLVSAVDSGAVDSMLDAFKNIKKEEIVEETGANAADFGLATPKESASFTNASGTTKTINFGIDNPTGQYAYAQVKGEAPVFLVMKYLKGNIIREAKDLRDKNVWSFDEASVQGIKSTMGNGLTLVKGKDGLFSLTAPLKAPGDQDAIKAWFGVLKNLRIDTFVDDAPKNTAKYGLDASSPRLTIDLGPKVPPWVLLQGKTLGSTKSRHYMVQGGHMVFSLAEYNNASLEKKASELVKKPDPTPVPSATATPAKK